MIQAPVFGQRDARWKSEKHGSSTSTIGSTGCTISSLASLLQVCGYNETPSTVNKRLTDGAGYAQGNLVVWTKIASIWNLNFDGRLYKYDNAKVVEYLKNGFPVLCEVDGAPIGAPGGRHWILLLGDGKCIDPWKGVVEEFSKWSPTGLALYSWKKRPETVEIIKEPEVSELLKHINVKTQEEAIQVWDQEMGYLKDARARVGELEAEVKTLKGKLADEALYVKGLTDEINTLAVDLKTTKEQNILFQKQIVELQSHIPSEVQPVQETPNVQAKPTEIKNSSLLSSLLDIIINFLKGMKG